MRRQLIVLLLAGMLASVASRDSSAEATPAAATSLAELCAQLANDPTYIPATNEGFEPTPYLDEENLRSYARLLNYRVGIIYNLRRVQLSREMEAALNLTALGLPDKFKGKLPPGLEKLRELARTEAKWAEDSVKAFARDANELFGKLCGNLQPPRVITMQPLPGLLLPGLALGGVVAAPLPPAGITPPSVDESKPKSALHLELIDPPVAEKADPGWTVDVAGGKVTQTDPSGFVVEWNWSPAPPARIDIPGSFKIDLTVKSKSAPRSNANVAMGLTGGFDMEPVNPFVQVLSEDGKQENKKLSVSLTTPKSATSWTAGADIYLLVGAGRHVTYHYVVVGGGTGAD